MSRNVRLDDSLTVAAPSAEEARFIYQEVFTDDCYLAPFELPDAPVVFDVGANIGLFALKVWQDYPQAQLFCFEPAPITFECLERNLAGLQAELHQVGLAESDGQADFSFYPTLPGNSSLVPRQLNEALLSKMYLAHQVSERVWWRRLPFRLPWIGRPLFDRLVYYVWGRPQVVRTDLVRLSSFLSERCELEIDLLKIDVERAELRVLEGIEESHFERIHRLVVEVTSFDFDDPHLEAVVAALEPHGYQIEVHEAELAREVRQAIESQLGVSGRVDHLVYAQRR